MLISCNDVQKCNLNDEKINDTLNIVKYAQNFEIYPFESGYRLIINNNTLENNEYYIFSDTVDVPESVSNKQIVRTPIKSAVAF